MEWECWVNGTLFNHSFDGFCKEKSLFLKSCVVESIKKNEGDGAFLFGESLEKVFFLSSSFRNNSCQRYGTITYLNKVKEHSVWGSCFVENSCLWGQIEYITSPYGSHSFCECTVHRCPSSKKSDQRYLIFVYDKIQSVQTKSNFSFNELSGWSITIWWTYASCSSFFNSIASNVILILYESQCALHYAKYDNVVNNTDNWGAYSLVHCNRGTTFTVSKTIFIGNSFTKLFDVLDGEIYNFECIFYGNTFKESTAIFTLSATAKPWTYTFKLFDGWECLSPPLIGSKEFSLEKVILELECIIVYAMIVK